MKDLNAQNRRMEYWWRRNSDKVYGSLLVVWILLAFIVFPLMGLYIIS